MASKAVLVFGSAATALFASVGAWDCSTMEGTYAHCDGSSTATLETYPGAGPCEFEYTDLYIPEHSPASIDGDTLTVVVMEGEHAGSWGATIKDDGSFWWHHSSDCSMVKAEVFFYVSSARMNQAAGESYCSEMGMSLAAIYDEEELGKARWTLEEAYVEKAITAARSDGNGEGWRWLHHDEKWERDGFPYNTGKVEDQPDGFDNGIYSLHPTSDDFVWDADGDMEEHPVLCRGMGTPSPMPIQRPCVTISGAEVSRLRAMGYEPRTCEDARRLRRLKGLNPGPPCPTQKGKKNPDNMMGKKKNPFSSPHRELEGSRTKSPTMPQLPKLPKPFFLRGASKAAEPLFQV